MKIISGGQSGADLGGIDYAIKYGIDCEINIFKNFKPIKDILPDKVKLNFICDKSDYVKNLRCRTEYNVLQSDLTIILISRKLTHTKGSLLTYSICKKYKKPYYIYDIRDTNIKKLSRDSLNELM